MGYFIRLKNLLNTLLNVRHWIDPEVWNIKDQIYSKGGGPSTIISRGTMVEMFGNSLLRIKDHLLKDEFDHIDYVESCIKEYVQINIIDKINKEVDEINLFTNYTNVTDLYIQLIDEFETTLRNEYIYYWKIKKKCS